MRDCSIRILCFIFALVAMETEAGAQATVPRSQTPMAGTSSSVPVYPGVAVIPDGERTTMAMVDPDRKLQQGDQLSFSIEEDREPAISLVVGASGNVRIEPLFSVTVAGHTVSEAARMIKQKLEADYYYTATVRLALERVNPTMAMGFVFLSGEVNRVGAVQIPGDRPLTLSQAIIQSGGATHFGALTKVKVTRTGKNGAVDTFIKDVKAVIEGKPHAEQDMPLQDGDRIYIPRVLFTT